MAGRPAPPLNEWLRESAHIDGARVEQLERILASEWVTDVASLKRCLGALQGVLPAAAFVAICEAITEDTQRKSTQSPPAERNQENQENLLQEKTSQENSPRDNAMPAELLLQASREREERADRRRRELHSQVQSYRKLLRRKKPCAIHPTSAWLRMWDCVLLLPALLLTAFYTPFEVGYLPLADDALWRLNRGVDAVMLSDCLLQFFIAFREPPARGGRLVTSLSRIAGRYVKSWQGCVDLLAAPPYEVLLLLLATGGTDSAAFGLGSGSELLPGSELGGLNALGFQLARLATLMRMLKLLRLLRLSRMLQRWEEPLRAVPHHLAKAGALFAGLLVVAHWLACVWGYVGRTGAIAEAVAAAAIPPPPPSPPSNDTSIGNGGESGGESSGRGGGDFSGSWILQAGLSTTAPAYQLYAVALYTTLAMLLGAPSGVRPANDAESYLLGGMQLVAGLLWCYAIASCCALAPSAWAHVSDEARVEEEVDVLSKERSLTASTSKRLRGFLASAAPLARSAKYSRLLERMSARLRGDTAHAVAKPLLSQVCYLRQRPLSAGGVEPDFLANVALALERSLHAPRESISATALTLVERGLGARRGLLLPPGKCIGEDMIVHLPIFRDDAAAAVALSYTQVAVLTKQRLASMLATGAYPFAVRAVRAAAVTLALRRATLLVAARIRDGRRVAAASPGMPAPYTGVLTCSTPWGAPYVLLAAEPMSELLAECNAAEAEKATDSLSSLAAVGEADADQPDDERVWRAIDACGSRMETTVEAMAQQLKGRQLAAQQQQQQQPPISQQQTPAYGPAYSAAPVKRARRNVCAGPQAPAAQTVVITPGVGLPADHLLLEA